MINITIRSDQEVRELKIHKMAQAAKRFSGSRTGAALFSAVITGAVYRYCAALALLERGGKTAYGGECLVALTAGLFIYHAVRRLNERS